ncbi:GerAB/ArcD/ProY family transporter [Halobacillus salinus]|uniref:GerAB/ArcD/ProY family transporter n=1 Tax=Halobacillus salinus TaxID=192814 RepID=UPI001305158B|nr:GerAB/ArcD/ProY family transporter [Halobacillus salinus]
MSDQTTSSSQNNPLKKVSQQVQKAVQTPTPNQQQKISRRQFFFLLIQTQIGVGVLSLPSDLHQVAKQDGWISLAIAGSLLPIILIVLYFIAKQFPNDDFYQINEKLFTRWGGVVFSILYIIYFCMVARLILLLFGRMISLWVLPNTPFWVLALCMVVVGLYMCNGGLLVIARFYTMVSILLIFLIVLMFLSFKEAHWMYLLPIGEVGIGKILQGSTEAFMSFLGFFLSLVVFSKVEGKPREKLKTILQAHLFTFSFYMLTLLISYSFFSTKELSLVTEPLLYMLKSFEMPFVARIDLFFISVWFVSVATSYTTYLYMASFGLQQIFRAKSIKLFTLIVSILIFSLSQFVGLDMERLEKYSTIVVYEGYALTFLMPFLLLVYVLIYKRIQQKKERST